MTKKRGRTCRKRRRRCSLEEVQHVDPQQALEHCCRTRGLLEWMHSLGFVHMKKLKPCFFKATGRGMLTLESIRPGDVIVSLPQALLLTTGTVKRSYLNAFLQRYKFPLEPLELLTVFIMCEKARGELSPWGPYLSMLPQSFSVPAYMTDEVLKCLPADIYRLAVIQHSTFDRAFNRVRGLLERLESHFPAFRGVLNFEFFRWAWFAVSTRCVYLDHLTGTDDHCALPPFLDLLNHSFKSRIKAGINLNNGCYEIVSLSSYKKREQVFINYGSHDNRRLFLEYGFVLPDNPNDVITFTIDNILESYRDISYHDEDVNVLAMKLSYLGQRGLLRALGCTREGLTWSLKVTLAILASKAKCLGEIASILEEELAEEENFLYEAMASHLLNMRLENYNRDPTQEFIQMQGVNTEHLKLVSTLIKEEKLILLQALDNISWPSPY